MKYLVQRGIRASLLLLAGLVGLAWFHWQIAPGLKQPVHLTGWSLFAVILFLAVYNARKKLPFLPLGRSSSWLQLHVYVGWFSFALFGVHLGWRLPTGGFEILLAALYLLTAFSGVVGLFWSRWVPRRLTARGGEVLFERIPVIRRELAAKAEALAIQSVTATRSSTIADFHGAHLDGFMRGPKHLLLHLLGSTRPLRALLGKMEDLQRFVNADQKQVLTEFGQIVRQKDGLDFHYANQLSLKLWLFTHIPLTYGLLLATVLHVVLIYGFSGHGPIS